MTVHRRGVFNHAAFLAAIETERERRGISNRELSRQADINAAGVTLTHLRQGHAPSAETVARLLVWLGNTDLAPYIHIGDSSGGTP